MSELWITNRRRAQSRLPRLAKWLREVSQLVNGATFDLDVLGEFRRDQPPRNVNEASQCGFRGCALGWATLEPSFRKAGLRLVEDIGSVYGRPGFDETARPAAEFFGISFRAASCIFGESTDDWSDGAFFEFLDEDESLDPEDPIAAAERVERFCADNGIALEGGAP